MHGHRFGWAALGAVALCLWAGGAHPFAAAEPAPKAAPSPPPQPEMRQQEAPLLFARKLDGEARRTTTDPEVIEKLLRQMSGAEQPKPEEAPAWELVLFKGTAQRTFAYWDTEGILGEETPEGDYRCRKAGKMGTLLETLSAAITPIEPAKNWQEVQALPRITSHFPTIGGLSANSGRVFLGRVVGVAECYYAGRPDRPLQWTSYVVRVGEEFKRSRHRRGRYVRLKWPGGYLNGGETWRYPLLNVETDYIFFTASTYRKMEDKNGNEWLEDHGEDGIVTQAWGGWIGFGLLRIRNGIVVPAFEHVEAELNEHVARGGEIPLMSRFTKNPFPAWGLPVNEYLKHLRKIRY